MPSPARAPCPALQGGGKEKAPSLRISSQRPNEELTPSHRMQFIHSLCGYLLGTVYAEKDQEVNR